MLKEKGKKEKKEKAIEKEGQEGEKVRMLKGKEHFVMLARKKDLFKEHDDKTPMFLMLTTLLLLFPVLLPLFSRIMKMCFQRNFL